LAKISSGVSAGFSPAARDYEVRPHSLLRRQGLAGKHFPRGFNFLDSFDVD
jgi:hypothetical protein